LPGRRLQELKILKYIHDAGIICGVAGLIANWCDSIKSNAKKINNNNK